MIAKKAILAIILAIILLIIMALTVKSLIFSVISKDTSGKNLIEKMFENLEQEIKKLLSFKK